MAKLRRHFLRVSPGFWERVISPAIFSASSPLALEISPREFIKQQQVQLGYKSDENNSAFAEGLSLKGILFNYKQNKQPE
jgi:hypothetical protein